MDRSIGSEKSIMDVDRLGMVAKFSEGVDMSPNGQALDAIKENGPNQHFLGTAHALANFETAFHRSNFANNDSFEQWTEDSELDAATRANAIWKEMLANYELPQLDDAIDAELLDYIGKRKSEMPDGIG